jgi:hypothetical protein
VTGERGLARRVYPELRVLGVLRMVRGVGVAEGEGYARVGSASRRAGRGRGVALRLVPARGRGAARVVRGVARAGARGVAPVAARERGRADLVDLADRGALVDLAERGAGRAAATALG